MPTEQFSYLSHRRIKFIAFKANEPLVTLNNFIHYVKFFTQSKAQVLPLGFRAVFVS